MLLAVPQSVLVLLPKTNMRGPMLAVGAINALCLNHIVTTKLVTFPKPRAELVATAKFPPVVPPCGFDETFNARLGLVNPATPEFAAPWRLVPPPFWVSICKVTDRKSTRVGKECRSRW